MKRKIIYILLTCLSVFIIVACNGNPKLKKEETVTSKDNNSLKEQERVGEVVPADETLEKVKNMTLKEKVGQLMIVGFEGDSLNEDIEKYIEDFKVSGFIFFSRNITDSKQLFDLINNIKDRNRANDHPLFISVDEEGGRVSRLPNEFIKLPPAKKMGDINKEELSYEYGQLIANRLKDLGFNMDFAPVLDINSNPKNPVIGVRAFSNKKDIVEKNALAMVDGLRDENIIPVVKHFPGHGDTKEDSHISLPLVNKSIEEIKDLELLPFMKAIKNDIEGIMVAHILYDNIDSNYPASLSKVLIGNLLRKDLAYDGVVFSDDITMGAIVENYSLEDASIKFLQAGGDVLLICHGSDNPQKIFEKIEESIVDGNLDESEIDKKLYRILKLKKKYKLEDKLIEDLDIKENNKAAEDFLDKLN